MKAFRSFGQGESAESSVVEMQSQNSMPVNQNKISFKTSTINFPLFGVPIKDLIRAVAIDTDKIICTFILAFAYLFVVLEEVDYQVLSSSNQFSGKKLIDRDSWRLLPSSVEHDSKA